MAGKLAKAVTVATQKQKLIKLPAADYHLLDINFTNPGNNQGNAKIYISDTETVGDVTVADLVESKLVIPANGGTAGRTCMLASANEVVWIECDIDGVVVRLTNLDRQPV